MITPELPKKIKPHCPICGSLLGRRKRIVDVSIRKCTHCEITWFIKHNCFKVADNTYMYTVDFSFSVTETKEAS